MNSLQNTNNRLLTLNNVKVLSKLLLLFCLIVSGCSSSEKKSSEPPLSSFSLKSRDGSFISNEDPLMKARMNAPYFYQWLHDKELKDPETKALLETQGIVGDSHFLNYGDWLTTKGTRIVRLSDPDDHGKGPFLAEIIRFSTVALSTKYNLTAKELIDAYVKGLSGKPAAPTEEVKALEKITATENLQMQQKYVQSLYTFTNDTYAFTKKAKSTPMNQAPADLKELYSQIRPDLLPWLEKNQYQILLEGYVVKKDGGSAGYPRFHYLVEDSKKQIKLIEFKYQPTKPAVGFYNTNQEWFLARLNAVKTSWIGAPLASTFDAIEIGARPSSETQRFQELGLAPLQFYVRERAKSVFDLEDLKDPAAVKKNILYLAQQIGFWSSKYQKETVAQVSRNLLNQKNKSRTKEKLIKLIDEFLQSQPK